MIDKNARRRLLNAEQRIERLEDIIRDMIDAQHSIVNQSMSISIPTGCCLKCNMGLYADYVCPNNDCPHGLDEDGE